MQPAQPTPLAVLVKSLAGLHQAQHQALMDMKLEPEDRFRLLVQAQDEDRRAIRSLLGREENPVAVPSIAHVPLMKMGPHDDPETFVDLFEKTAEACGWARSQWPVRLIPPADGGSTGSGPTVPNSVLTPARSHRPRTAPHRNAPQGSGAQPPLSPSGTQEKRSSGRVKGHAKLGRNRRIA